MITHLKNKTIKKKNKKTHLLAHNQVQDLIQKITQVKVQILNQLTKISRPKKSQKTKLINNNINGKKIMKKSFQVISKKTNQKKACNKMKKKNLKEVIQDSPKFLSRTLILHSL